MSKSSLDHAKELALQLSAEDRAQLINSLVESFSDAESVEDAKETEGITVDGDRFVILSTSTNAVILYKGCQVFQVVFNPQSFRQARMGMHGWKDAPPLADVRDQIQSTLRLHGMPELTEDKLAALFRQSSLQVFEAETDRISCELSARLPHIAHLLFDGGITIVELAVRSDFAGRTGQRRKTLDETVKILAPYWEQIKAHLGFPLDHVESVGPSQGRSVDSLEGGIQISEERKGFFDVTTRKDMVIGHIEDVEIFRLTFNPKNFVEQFHRLTPVPEPSAAQKANARATLQRHDPGRSEEEINAASEAVASTIQKVVFEEKTKHIAERIAENLDQILIAVMEDAIKAYAIESSVELNKQAGRTLPIAKLKDEILKQHWSRIRDLAGIKRGGARERRGFVWTDSKKIAFFEQVEALPKYKDKSIWQFLLGELAEQAFDAETITWLKTHPAVADMPPELFDRAIRAWRKYLLDERWEEIEPEDKPRSFEFRHALGLLGYPDEYALSTLETYYYEGKKLSDNQTPV